jgi:outer membrane beta-barrel protein
MRALVLVVALTASSTAYAEEDDQLDMGHFVASEPRANRLVHELRATVGVLPIDAFQTAISVGGAYAVHLNDVFAWEALSFDYAARFDTGVEARLAEDWSIAPAFERPALQYLLGTHFVAAPLYGKIAVLNEEIVYAAAHFSAGGGLAHYSDGFQPHLSFGPGMRIFLSSVFSARFDLRGTVVPDSFYLGASISLSFAFGKTRVTESEDAPPAVKKKIDPFDVLDQLYPDEAASQ